MLGVAPGYGRVLDMVALRHPARRPGSGVARDAVALLAPLQIQGNGDHRLRRYLEVYGVRVRHLASGDADRLLAAEGQSLERRGVDTRHAGHSALGESDGRSRDGQVGTAKSVGDLEADPVGADGHVKGLAERGVLELAATGLGVRC